MYIKVYIFGMKMSQRIHFWYQILSKITIFLLNKMAKKTTVLVKNSRTAYKTQFWVKNAETAVKTSL